MFWLILGEENDIYPLTAALSVNALDPHPSNVNLTQTVQWVGMDGFPYRPDSFVLMLRYCANLKAIRYESTSLNRIATDKSHRVIVA